MPKDSPMTSLSLNRGKLEQMSPILAATLFFPLGSLLLAPKLSPVGGFFLPSDAPGGAAGVATVATAPIPVVDRCTVLSSTIDLRNFPCLSELEMGRVIHSSLCQCMPWLRTICRRRSCLHTSSVVHLFSSTGPRTCDLAPAKYSMTMVRVDSRPPSPVCRKLTEDPFAVTRLGT